MNNDRLEYINVRRILNRIIDDSQIINEKRSFTYDDIKRALLSDTAESRITEALRILVSEGILRDKDTSLGRPPKYLTGNDQKLKNDKKLGRKPKYYQVIQNPIVFEKIFYMFLNNEVEKFLTSLYANNTIKQNGFATIYEIIMPFLERFNFKQIASNSLLDLPAVKEEFRGPTKLMDEHLLSERYEAFGQSTKGKSLFDLIIESRKVQLWDERRSMIGSVIGCRLKPIRSNRIKILSQLDPKKAVTFYRDTIQADIENIFSELYKRSLITRSLNQFMEYDVRLSPFTSYPINSPSDILFLDPFRRIYDDVYLLDENDLSVFYQRALTVYEHFGDILFEYFRNNIDWIYKMEPWIKQFIFQWNMSSKNFDSIWDYLETANYNGIGSGMYHVYLNGGRILSTDLETNKPLPYNYECRMNLEDSEETWDDMIGEFLFPPIVDHMSACREINFCDPYRNIVPCECFEYCPNLITYEQIFSDIKLRFAEYGWDYDKIDKNQIQ